MLDFSRGVFQGSFQAEVNLTALFSIIKSSNFQLSRIRTPNFLDFKLFIGSELLVERALYSNYFQDTELNE